MSSTAHAESVKVTRDVVYAPAHGVRGLADLYRPERIRAPVTALVIHGGGWQAMDKDGLAGVAMLLAETGLPALAVNYRLIGDAPWPACFEDCLLAARLLLEPVAPPLSGLPTRSLLVVGASAGGHLALMTGFALPLAQVAGIVSISGPTDLVERARPDDPNFKPEFWSRFFGRPGPIPVEWLRAASPLARVPARTPPLLCLHSVNDRLVTPVHSERIVAACRPRGPARLFTFAGEGLQHGIWRDDAEQPHRLVPCLEAEVRHFALSATQNTVTPA